ncbi:hypothetical protein ACH4F6_00425 [Streptomyces sp. NPDC017936]|uniref:hypothetical protein n=1 Tax=Streptomyces sp. NPDC017936 TaxID=3365016 RepID=UPI00378EBF42
MSSPHDDRELSHPLEQVTGEKDVPPEEEEGSTAQDAADADRQEPAVSDAEEPSSTEDST